MFSEALPNITAKCVSKSAWLSVVGHSPSQFLFAVHNGCKGHCRVKWGKSQNSAIIYPAVGITNHRDRVNIRASYISIGGR